jgi:hypothetical protein
MVTVRASFSCGSDFQFSKLCSCNLSPFKIGTIASGTKFYSTLPHTKQSKTLRTIIVTDL